MKNDILKLELKVKELKDAYKFISRLFLDNPTQQNIYINYKSKIRRQKSDIQTLFVKLETKRRLSGLPNKEYEKLSKLLQSFNSLIDNNIGYDN